MKIFGIFNKDESLDSKIEKMIRRRDVKGLVALLRLTHMDLRDRVFIVYELRKFNDKLAASAVTEQLAIIARGLRDPIADVRAEPAKALGIIGDHTSTNVLLEATTDNNREVRCRAIEALGSIGGPNSCDTLLKAFNDTDPMVQETAVKAITFGKFTSADHFRIIEALVPFLTSSNKTLRAKVLEQLIHLHWEQQTDDERARFRIAADQWDALSVLGAAAVAPLVDCLEDVDEERRIKAIEALASIGLSATQVLPILENMETSGCSSEERSAIHSARYAIDPHYKRDWLLQQIETFKKGNAKELKRFMQLLQSMDILALGECRAEYGFPGNIYHVCSLEEIVYNTFYLFRPLGQLDYLRDRKSLFKYKKDEDEVIDGYIFKGAEHICRVVRVGEDQFVYEQKLR
ncbi:HEAT repeat domain-containing protein [Chloroflexota bacterium]